MVKNAGYTDQWAKVPRFPDLATLDESMPSLNVLPEGGHRLILAHCNVNLRQASSHGLTAGSGPDLRNLASRRVFPVPGR